MACGDQISAKDGQSFGIGATCPIAQTNARDQAIRDADKWGQGATTCPSTCPALDIEIQVGPPGDCEPWERDQQRSPRTWHATITCNQTNKGPSLAGDREAPLPSMIKCRTYIQKTGEESGESPLGAQAQAEAVAKATASAEAAAIQNYPTNCPPECPKPTITITIGPASTPTPVTKLNQPTTLTSTCPWKMTAQCAK